MNPYREQDKIVGSRWGATSWTKLYIKVVRRFFDIRFPYRYRRVMRKFHKAIDEWQAIYGERPGDHLTPSRYMAMLKQPPPPTRPSYPTKIKKK